MHTAGDNLETRVSLLRRLRDFSDSASWNDFFDSYWRLIYNVARKAGLADHAAQDIVQETVIAVARKMPEFRYDPEVGSFKQWLLLVTRRRITDHFRKNARALQTVELQPGDDSPAVATSHPAPDDALNAAWEEEWHNNILALSLDRVRKKAQPKHCQAFELCVLQGLRPAEAARMLGMSMPQVYLARHRVTKAIKREAKAIEIELHSPKAR